MATALTEALAGLLTCAAPPRGGGGASPSGAGSGGPGGGRYDDPYVLQRHIVRRLISPLLAEDFDAFVGPPLSGNASVAMGPASTVSLLAPPTSGASSIIVGSSRRGSTAERQQPGPRPPPGCFGACFGGGGGGRSRPAPRRTPSEDILNGAATTSGSGIVFGTARGARRRSSEENVKRSSPISSLPGGNRSYRRLAATLLYRAGATPFLLDVLLDCDATLALARLVRKL